MEDFAFLVGQPVVEVRDDNRLVFDAGNGPAPSVYVWVGDCVCTDANGNAVTIPALTGRTVASATADAGVLRLRFADGASLRCEPHPEYEAWEIGGGDPETLVVCLPGGELAVWETK